MKTAWLASVATVVAGCGGGAKAVVATDVVVVPVTIGGAYDLPLSARTVPLGGDHAFAVVTPADASDDDDDDNSDAGDDDGGQLRIGRASQATPLSAAALGAARAVSWDDLDELYALAPAPPTPGADKPGAKGGAVISNSAEDPAALDDDELERIGALERIGGEDIEVVLTPLAAPLTPGAAVLLADAALDATTVVRIAGDNQPSRSLALAVRGHDGRAAAWSMALAAAAPEFDDEGDDDDYDDEAQEVRLELDEQEVYLSATADYYGLRDLTRDDALAEELKLALDQVGGEASIDLTGEATLAELVTLVDALGALGATRVVVSADRGGDGRMYGVFGALGGVDDGDVVGGIIGSGLGDGGGFGAGSGLGAGAGGAGWGTIGTGRYGSIGSGSGSAARTTAVPSTKVGSPTVSGQLNVEILQRYIKRNLAKVKYCYEKSLLAQPSLAGTVKVEFTIADDGKVATSAARGVDPDVSTCVSAVIKGIEFPKPTDGKVVKVSQEFTFAPSGSTP